MTKKIYVVDEDQIVREVEVSETKKLYKIVDSKDVHLFGYRSQIYKGDSVVSVTEEEAIKNYTDACKSEIDECTERIKNLQACIDRVNSQEN